MELSIIIPVYRETAGIIPFLERLFSLEPPLPFEVILVDGEKEQSTLGHIRNCRFLPGDIQVRMIGAPKGRGIQMNAGAAAAKGRLLFFLHADTWLTQEGMDQMAAAWQTRSSSFFCGAFDLKIDAPRPGFRLVEKTASLRSRLTRIPYGDQGIFMSRTLFDAVKGFPPVPLMEDVGLMSAVKKKGYRPLFLNAGIHTSARRWERLGILATTLRNWGLISLYLLGVSPLRLARIY